MAAAVVHRRGAQRGVASLHLPLPATQRLDHARRLVEVLRLGGSEHLFAAGDVNERPTGPVWGWLAEQGLRDLGPGTGRTFPAIRPDRRIDGAFASDGVELVDFRVVDDPRALVASDHLPLLVTVRIPAGLR